MSQQYPSDQQPQQPYQGAGQGPQPYQGYPQGQQPPTGPQGPQWGQPGYQPPQAPQGPKKPWVARHKVLTGFGGVIALIVVISVASSGGSDDTSKKADTVAAAPQKHDGGAKTDDKPAAKKPAAKHKAKPAAQAKPKADLVVFKVWGNAPAGALGPIDITYGSDSDNIQGHGVPMTKTLKLNDDAMYYNVTAQLQGSGDIHCSVTVDGKTKTGHAQGGYNICTAQLSGGLFGGWE